MKKLLSQINRMTPPNYRKIERALNASGKRQEWNFLTNSANNSSYLVAPLEGKESAVTVRETWVEKIPLEEGMATHSSIFAWRIPMDEGAWQVTVHGGHKELDTTERRIIIIITTSPNSTYLSPFQFTFYVTFISHFP